MISEELRETVYRANLALVESGLAFETFGNVSGVDRKAGVMVIKPSGMAYDQLTPARMVLVSLESGRPVEGDLRPSSDTATHLELYRAFRCGGIAHAHSEAATALAQARLPLRCLGTTHSDYFRGDVPVTRDLTPDEVEGEYEKNTGAVIVETFRSGGISPEEVPAVLVASHAPFVWGPDPMVAVENLRVLELLARIDHWTRNPGTEPGPAPFLVDRHYFRKHGKGRYYGQP